MKNYLVMLQTYINLIKNINNKRMINYRLDLNKLMIF
jgi:hypothetical protein